MKRKGLFILCAIISLTLCACGGGSKLNSYEPSHEEKSSSGSIPDSEANGSDEEIADNEETWEEEKARLEEEQRRRMEEQAAQEQSVRQMLEDQASYESDSYEDEAEEGTAESDTVGENICPDCGFERLEVTCGLCSGTGNTASCTRCGGTGIICRNCFYPPSQPSTAGGTSGKAGRMCGRCHGDGLEESPKPTIDMTDEEQSETIDHAETVKNELFDIILSNPPFSMNYQRSKEEDKHIIDQFDFTIGQNSVKSSVLFLNRYEKLLKKGGEMLIVLDDTILNGKSYEDLRKWLLERFVLLGIHSLPFNTFLKAKANIKTSILHLRKKIDEDDSQGNIFMSISNNIGHDNSLKDTPTRNNLIEILIAYLEWQRTGNIETTIKDNADPQENLECPMQYWIVNPQDITTERFDAFFYCPELHNLYSNLQKRENKKEVEIKRGEDFNLVPKLTKQDKTKMIEEQNIYRYVEIGDVTTYGLITHYIMGTFDELPTRGEYQVKKGDILLALNNSSRGTVVRVPDEFDGMICTSGFLVIRPKNEEEGLLLWYCLRSDICKKQIYYLAQTASQPELKIESWNKYFRIPFPVNTERAKAIERTKKAFDYINNLSDINNEKFQ